MTHQHASYKSGRWRKAFALGIVLSSLAGCAATIERSGTSSGPVTGTGGSAATASGPPSLKIAPASAKRLVLNMQLAPEHPKDSGWNEFKKEWHDIGREQATAKKIAFVAQEGEAKPTGEEGTLVVVNIRDYKVVSQAARIMLGIFTGNAYINASVDFRDLKTGALIGQRSYDTTSSAWQGVFAPTTYKQIYAMVDQIIDEMTKP